MSNKNGDVKFTDPTYFKYVDFFYCSNTQTEGKGPNDKGYSVFFTELAQGGAEIGALNDEDYSVGYYRPGLTYLPAIDQKIKGIEITCYRVEDGEFMGQVFKKDNLDISAADFYEQFANDAETSVGEYQKDDNVSKAKYIIYNDSRDFANGDYMYKMTVTLADGQILDTVESNPFTIFNTQIKTPVNATQLVKYKDQNNKYVTFRMNNGQVVTPAYNVIVSGSDITLSAFDGTPDYADGSKFEFSDNVLLTGSGHLEADQVNSYKLTINDDDQGDQSSAMQSAYDDRFMKVVSQKLSSTKYELTMDYKMNFTADGLPVTTSSLSTPVATNFALTVPSPRVKQAYVQTYYGSSVNDNAAKTFSFTTSNGTPFTIESARYQNVKEVVEIEAPNVTSELNDAMGENFFSYYFQKDDNTTDKSERITIGADGFMPSSAVIPSTLFVAEKATGEDKWDKKYVKYESKEGVNIYGQRWNSINEGVITSIRLTDDAPLNEDQKDLNGENADIRIINILTAFEDDNTENLIGSFDIYVEMKVPEGNKNYIQHIDKDVNGDVLLHGDTETGRYDYFFLSVYDMSKGGDGELVVSHPVVGGSRTNSEFVAKVEELHPNFVVDEIAPNVEEESNGNGYTIHIRNNLGTFDNGFSWAEVLKKHNAYREYIRNLQLRISYIYPFNVDGTTTNNIKARVGSKLQGQIVKSEATTWSLGEAYMDPGIATGIEGIGQSEGYVRTGHGFIEVEGENVVIYNTSGICIATQEGRYDVNPGVYVVRLNGQTRKVVVK